MDEYTAPDFRRCALITIDTQCNTLDGEPFEIPGTSAILPQVFTLLNAFRSGGRSIVHVVRLYKSDGSNADPCRRRIIEQGAQLLVPGSRGSCLAPGLLGENVVQLDTAALLAGQVQQVTSREAVIYKPRWGLYDRGKAEVRNIGVAVMTSRECVEALQSDFENE